MKLPKNFRNIDKKSVVKIAIGAVVSAGVSKIITGIIETNVDSTSAKDKIVVTAAKIALTGIVGIACKRYVDETIDRVIDTYHDISEEVKAEFVIIEQEEI